MHVLQFCTDGTGRVMPPALWVQRSEEPEKALPADMEVADARRVVLCGIAAARARSEGGTPKA